MSDKLLELADRCERASGPNAELDSDIWRAVFGRGEDEDPACDPEYTSSLDEAMSLLNNTGVLMSLSDIGADGLPLARVGVPGIDGGPIFTGIASCIMTDTSPVCGLALSLCAASLRARASHLRMEVE